MRSEKASDYKIIDTHCHIFPDKLALAASQNIGSYYSLPVGGNGTIAGLVEPDEGISAYKYVVCSAATKARHVPTANDFIYAAVQACDKLVGLGTAHADYEQNESEIERIIQLNLRGIKLHTDFQGFDIDDPKMDPVYRLCEKYRLPVLFHVGDQKSDRSRADKLYNVLQKFPEMVVIAAHMGGYTQKALAEKYFVGTPVYFDCSDWNRYMSGEELADMIRRHGIDKVMFGSDYPLCRTGEMAKMLIDSTDLSHDELQKIFFGNAAKLFKID